MTTAGPLSLPLSLSGAAAAKRAASTRAGKTALIGEVRGKFDKSTSTVFLDYKGMTVETANKLRASFRKAGVEYTVVKNTLVRHALKDTVYSDKLGDVLTGMTGIAWCYEDPSVAAKVVKAFRKEEGEAGEKLKIKAGLIEGTVLDAQGVEEQLAMMPGKDELRAKLLATFQAPLQQFVMLLNAPAQNFVYLLSAKEREDAKG
jgi:large subunit ribosomal protein L10